MTLSESPPSPEGILLINKSKGSSSFRIVQILRKKLNVKKIGHAGTLDPFATGVMVMLIGKKYTKLSSQFLESDKEYVAELFLGQATDTYDSEGVVVKTSTLIPSLAEIIEALHFFQGECEQVPPMFSAKKMKGKKLYELARQGLVVERAPVKVTLKTSLIRYEWPILELHVFCSKGTYIRSIGHDLGEKLGCLAHLVNLKRIKSGQFQLKDCLDQESLSHTPFDTLIARLIHLHPALL